MKSRTWFVLLLGPLFASPSFVGRAGIADSVENTLVWDDTEKTVMVDEVAQVAEVSFAVSNRGSAPVTVLAVRASCGCTQVRTPALPWTLQPGDFGQVVASIDLKDKTGEFEKTIAIETTSGEEDLLVRVIRSTPLSPTERRALNQRKAKLDGQAIFRGDCARCHVPSATAVSGAEIYAQACAICHEAAHRAAGVPALSTAKARDAAYWQRWITEGRDRTMMPAFARERGGVLSSTQIEQLVSFLLKRFPTDPHESPASF